MKRLALPPVGLVAVVAIATLASGSALATGARASGGSLTFEVAFGINTGRFIEADRSLDRNNGNTRNENDELVLGPTASFRGLTIPASGAASSRILVRGAVRDSGDGTWEAYGKGPDQEGGIGSYDCRGRLIAPTKLTFIASGAGTAKTALNLHIQSTAGGLEVRSSTGDDALIDENCSHYNGQLAFWPAATDSQTGAELLTAHVQVPLAQLRALKKGQDLKIPVTEKEADVQPKADCSSGSYDACTEHLSWTGTIVFRRTS